MPWTPAEVVQVLKNKGDRNVITSIAGDTPEHVSGRAMLALVKGIQEALRDAGIESGDTVAIWAPNSPRWVAAGLACHLMGVVLAPVDAMLPAKDARDQVRDSGASLTLISATTEAAFGAGDATLALEDVAAVDGTPDTPCLAADQPIALFRTSGTTGKPKLFHLSLRNVGWNVRFICRSGEFTATDRVLLPLPMHHVFPWITASLSSLTLGAVLVLPESPTGPHIAQTMRLTRPTILVGVPRLYEALLAALRTRLRAASPLALLAYKVVLALVERLRRLPGGNAATLLLWPVRHGIAPDLRLVVSGGAHLDAAVEAEMEAIGWDVRGGYGLAETSASITAPIGGKRPGSTGQAVTGCEIRIDAPNAEGIGEILVRGPVVFSGYLNNPPANANAFTANGFFRTGDLGRLDKDGFLFVTGRAKEVIVLSGGDNVFPEDVERHYLAHPVIADIGIFETGGALSAIVVPDMAEIARRKLIDPREIVSIALTEVGKELPSTWRPSGFVLSREPLPRTRLMKLQRFLLPQIYEKARAAGSTAHKSKITEADKAWLAEPPQAELWALLQRQFPDWTPSLEGFAAYELGLDSFGWMNLSLAIEQQTGVSLTLTDISRIATVRDLLGVVAERHVEGRDKTPPQERCVAAARARWLAPRTAPEQVLGRMLHGLNALLMRVVFRLRVEGVEAFPALADRPVIFCPNHASDLDPLAVAAALPAGFRLRTYWSGSRGAAFGSRLRRSLARSVGMFPVDRESPMVAIELGRAALRDNKMLVWFPEGLLSPDGKLLRFHDGVGRLLEDVDAAVVPVVIEGTYAALPRERKIPRPRQVQVIFGPAVDAARLRADDAGPRDIAERIRAHVLTLGRDHGIDLQPPDRAA